MKLFILLFFIMTFLLFIPIPIRIKVYYSLNDYYVNIYNITFFSSKKHKSKLSKKTPPKYTSKNKKYFSKFKNLNYKNLLIKLYHLKFKPVLNTYLNVEYSLNDACNTAVCYGVLNNLNSPLYILLNIPFKTKKLFFDYKPIFEDKYLLKIESKSILFISFANIIYIMIIILKFIIVSKEVAPKT